MDMGEDTDDANGGVFLLIHDMVGESDEQFGEDFQNEFRFEILCGVGHDHGETFF
jgi:hypothetical protein